MKPDRHKKHLTLSLLTFSLILIISQKNVNPIWPYPIMNPFILNLPPPNLKNKQKSNQSQTLYLSFPFQNINKNLIINNLTGYPKNYYIYLIYKLK